MFDFGEETDDSQSLMDYEKDYKFILEKIFDNPEYKEMLAFNNEIKLGEKTVEELISMGYINLLRKCYA